MHDIVFDGTTQQSLSAAAIAKASTASTSERGPQIHARTTSSGAQVEKYFEVVMIRRAWEEAWEVAVSRALDGDHDADAPAVIRGLVREMRHLFMRLPPGAFKLFDELNRFEALIEDYESERSGDKRRLRRRLRTLMKHADLIKRLFIRLEERALTPAAFPRWLKLLFRGHGIPAHLNETASHARMSAQSLVTEGLLCVAARVGISPPTLEAYRVLGLPFGSGPDEVRSRCVLLLAEAKVRFDSAMDAEERLFRQHAMWYHPDRGGATSEMQQLNALHLKRSQELHEGHSKERRAIEDAARRLIFLRTDTAGEAVTSPVEVAG